MICILAGNKKPDYYKKLKAVLEHSRLHMQDETPYCEIRDCTTCENYDICMDLARAIMFLEGEQLRAEMKAQKKLPK